jgi:hypothetical protein
LHYPSLPALSSKATFPISPRLHPVSSDRTAAVLIATANRLPAGHGNIEWHLVDSE